MDIQSNSDTRPLQRLADAVRGARVGLGLTKEAAARRGSMSSITWKRAEDGLVLHELSLAKIERVLGWPAGTASRILSDGVGEQAGLTTDGDEVVAVMLDSEAAALMGALDAASPTARAAALAAAHAAIAAVDRVRGG